MITMWQMNLRDRTISWKKLGRSLRIFQKILELNISCLLYTSIDVVWKIAELFEISVQKLIEDDLSDLSGNIGMLVDFMDKLKEQTECVEIEWDKMCIRDRHLSL